MKLPAILKRAETITALGVVVLTGAVALANSGYIAPGNLVRVANSTVILALLAAGSAVVIITRNIDVSVGSTLVLAGVIGAGMLRDGHDPALVIAAMLSIGAVLGAINGIGVTYGHVPSIVMTLGTLGAYRGISFLITGGYSIENLPTSYRRLGSTSAFAMPILVWCTLLVLVVLALFMSKTRLGRHIYATGDNELGARLVGVRTNGVVIFTYVLSGLLAAAAAVVYLAQVGSISNQAGSGIEMRAIAAAVIGGVALTGGMGTLAGAALGALFVTSAVSSLSFLGIPGFWADTVIGAILLIALFTDARMRNLLAKRRLQDRYRAREEKLEASA